jgi:hypothetical protein
MSSLQFSHPTITAAVQFIVSSSFDGIIRVIMLVGFRWLRPSCCREHCGHECPRTDHEVAVLRPSASPPYSLLIALGRSLADCRAGGILGVFPAYVILNARKVLGLIPWSIDPLSHAGIGYDSGAVYHSLLAS